MRIMQNGVIDLLLNLRFPFRHDDDEMEINNLIVPLVFLFAELILIFKHH
jgi:hypothetical protein